MSNLVRNIFIMLFVCLPYSLYAATAYETDTVNYYVSDNAANDALSEVNFIMCMMAAMGADKMVNRGPYKVSLYEDDCKTADTSSSDASAAKPKSAQSAESNKSSEATTTNNAKTVTVAYADVTRATDSSPQIMKAWVEMKGGVDEEMMDSMGHMDDAMMAAMPKSPDILVYIKVTTTAGASATSQFGEFDMNMSFVLSANYDMGCPDGQSTAENIEMGCLQPAGSSVGGGRIQASGSEITYVDYRPMEPPLRTILSYDGDKIEGVSVDTVGISGGAPNWDWIEMEVVSAFAIDNGAAAVYCSKALSAAVLDFDDFTDSDDGYGMPGSTAVTLPHVASGVTSAETCFSLKESDSQKNVHRYGVYDVNGARAALSGVAGFPMNANVTDGDGAEVELFGWADYWNIHVEDIGGVKLWDANTVWTKESFANETGPALQITIDSANQRVSKVTKSYLSLNDLDKITLVSWINGNDDRWGSAFQSLGFPAASKEYEGSYNKLTETWTFTKSIDWTSGWNETVLTTPITFTNAQAIAVLSTTFEDKMIQQQPAMNGLQLNTFRLKITDYLQGSTLSASAAENVQYWWLSGADGDVGEKTFNGWPWGKDTNESPGIDLENLQGLINGTANAMPIKIKGYFGNLPNSGSGTTNVRVTLTQGNDTFRSETEDQITGIVAVNWTSNGTTMTATVPAGTSLNGSYNDGGTAVNFSLTTSKAFSKTVTLDTDGNAVFELILGESLKAVKDYASSFASFFSDGQEVNMEVDFGDLAVYTAESQFDAGDKFNVTVTVKSSPDVNAADAWTDSRGIWAWSPDTGKGYDMGMTTLQNPASSSTANGIQVETREELTPTNYPAKFKCVFNCTTAATINATAAAAKALNGQYGEPVVSPHVPTSVQYLKSGDRAGEHFEGVLAADVMTYTASGTSILDATATAMGFASTIDEDDVATAEFRRTPNDWNTEQLMWGIRTGRLLGGTDAEIATQLAKLECDRSDNTTTVSATNAYRNVHPVFSATATRYCENAYWEGTGPTTWYELEFGASEWQRKKYAKDSSTGAYVNFSRPETLYYEVPSDTTAYPKDAGKNVRLDFSGFGQLHGIPGNVINVKTGEVLGDFHNGEWSDTLRYVQRFSLEPYNGVDPVLTKKGSDVTYKVKALEGEQWLKKKDTAVGSQTYTKTAADLPAFSTILDVGPETMLGEDNTNTIGAVPAASTLFNDGKPSVIHGDLTVTF